MLVCGTCNDPIIDNDKQEVWAHFLPDNKYDHWAHPKGTNPCNCDGKGGVTTQSYEHIASCGAIVDYEIYPEGYE